MSEEEVDMGPTCKACKSTFYGMARPRSACHAMLNAVHDHHPAYEILQNQCIYFLE